MKLLIVLIIQTIFSIQLVSAQENTPTKNDQYNLFMKKRSTNNTIGLVSLGTGFVMIAVGAGEGLADAIGC